MQDATTPAAGFYTANSTDPEALARLTAQVLQPGQVPHAAQIARNIPIYDAPALNFDDADARRKIMSEWGWVLRAGPGVLVIRQAVTDHAALDTAAAHFREIIAQEAGQAGGGADHFAAAGNNARIWNSAQKLCLRDPATFVACFAAPAVDAVCEAWLGPAYQMTAQVNLVRPGGKAQEGHRDYHLGFQTAEQAARWPIHIHELSAMLTLQGAMAHVDMPVESGTTKLLPFSQTYGPGYVDFRTPAIRAHFEATCVQLPLAKGDTLFFNPALLHGAGDNVSAGIQRMGNLLQISSAFGQAMESLDRAAMAKAIYPALQAAQAAGMGDAQIAAAIAATAESYPFPTNLDTDPPVGGLAPATHATLLHQALADGWTDTTLNAEIDARDAKRRA